MRKVRCLSVFREAEPGDVSRLGGPGGAAGGLGWQSPDRLVTRHSHLRERLFLSVFSLADSEDQEPCYLMLPRMSYLPLATEKVSKHFSSCSQPEDGEMWFSHGGTPLRWHLPIGLLYDLTTLSPSQPASLPWQISVHTSQFPSDQLLPGGREQMESVFMSSLKEADQLKHSGKVISQMQKKDHNQLWSGLSSDKFDQVRN